MQADQVAALQAKEVNAQLLNRSLSEAERAALFQEVRNGEITLLYLAPEQLQNAETRKVLLGTDIALIAVSASTAVRPSLSPGGLKALFSQIRRGFDRLLPRK